MGNKSESKLLKTYDMDKIVKDADSLFDYSPTDVDELADPLQFNDTLSFNFKKIFKRSRHRDNDIATRRSFFENPDVGVAKQYFPPEKYENFHAFDPNLRWTFKEDRKLTRKIDWCIFTIVAVSCFALNLDRDNLSSAVSGGLLRDVWLPADDYNTGKTLRSVGFIIAEIPSQMIAKRYGPDRWIPIQVFVWSLIALFQFFINGSKSYLALRFLLGVAQGGFVANSVLYLSYFYTRKELSFRLSLFWFTDSVSSIINDLLAIAFLKVHLQGKGSWKWLFLFDGLITLAIGFAAFFFMVPGPTQTKTRWIPRGIFTEREEKIITCRLLRDDPTKSDMHNREGITWAQFIKTLLDFDLWPLLIISFVFAIPQIPAKAYLNISFALLGFDRDTIVYLGFPFEALKAIMIVLITLLSEFVDERSVVGSLQQFWILVVVAVEYALAADLRPWEQYAVMVFAIGYPSAQAILSSWCSRVSYSVRARALSAAMSNIGVQLAGITSGYIYRSDDAPHYHRGNSIIIGLCVMNIVIFVATKLYYIWRNHTKLAKWNSFTGQQKEDYIIQHRGDGNKRLDFLFEH